MANIQVIQAADEDVPRVRSFLMRFEDTSLFLLSNLGVHGPRATEHRNSGNFKILVDGDAVRGVFCLTRRGNLLLQTDKTEECTELIWRSVQTEPFGLEGIIGDADLTFALYGFLRDRGLISSVLRDGRERLYARMLHRGLESADHAPAIPLARSHFDEWQALSHAFAEEENLPEQGSRDVELAAFEEMVERGHVWGLELDGHLVATANLNACFGDVGQVGGVFTHRNFRRRGFNRKVMRLLIHSCANRLGLRKLVLFTGEHQVPAWSMYESLGFARTGDFGMVFFRMR